MGKSYSQAARLLGDYWLRQGLFTSGVPLLPMLYYVLMMKLDNVKYLAYSYLTAFAGGFCVMSIEIVAGRLIARYLGASLYTWTSVIGVVLAGISLGNYIGGWLADRFPAQKTLSALFIAASAGCTSVPVFNNLAGSAVIFLQLAWPIRIILHVSIIFLLPSCILGMISPVVAKLALDQGLGRGRTIGNIYASSNLGSIAGTFATGFLLIARIGTTSIVWTISGFLALMGILYLRKSLLARMWFCIFIFLGFMSFSPFAWTGTIAQNLFLIEPDKEDIVYAKDSQYSYVSIKRDTQNPRIYNFMLDDLIQTSMHLKEPLNLKYAYRCHSVFINIVKKFGLIKENPAILNIGGGGYIIPRNIQEHFPKSHIEVVEIDPEVTKAAIEFFGLAKESNIIIRHLDARNYVEEMVSKKKYDKDTRLFDFILSDVFTGGIAVPYHLTTYEYNEKITQLLTPNGLYVMNLIDSAKSPKFLIAACNTLSKSFKYIYVISTRRQEYLYESGYGTYVIVSSQKKIEENVFPAIRGYGQLLGEEELRSFKNNLGVNIVLTDDYAPVDNLLMDTFQAQGEYRTYRNVINSGMKLAEKNKLKEALNKFNAAIRINPNIAMAYNNLASVMARQKNYKGAVENYRKALGIDSEFIEAAIGLGNALERNGRYQEATEIFYKILEANPHLADVYVSLGNALLKEGKIDEAINCYRRALEIEPALQSAQKNLDTAIKKNNGE